MPDRKAHSFRRRLSPQPMQNRWPSLASSSCRSTAWARRTARRRFTTWPGRISPTPASPIAFSGTRRWRRSIPSYDIIARRHLWNVGGRAERDGRPAVSSRVLQGRRSPTAGCHDNRMDKIWWNEQWMGWPLGPQYAASSNVDNACAAAGQAAAGRRRDWTRTSIRRRRCRSSTRSSSTTRLRPAGRSRREPPGRPRQRSDGAVRRSQALRLLCPASARGHAAGVESIRQQRRPPRRPAATEERFMRVRWLFVTALAMATAFIPVTALTQSGNGDGRRLPVRWPAIPKYWPGGDGRPHRRLRRSREQPGGVLRRGRDRVVSGRRRTTARRGRRCSTIRTTSCRSATSRLRRAIATLVWVGTGENEQSTELVVGRRRLQVDRRRRTPGSRWALPTRGTSAASCVDPIDSDIVYVAALGHLLGPNKSAASTRRPTAVARGPRPLFVDDDHRRDRPRDGSVERQGALCGDLPTPAHRRGYNGGGPGSAIYKSIDAGRIWTKLTNGIPDGPLGRIGIDICRANPNVVYARIEHPNESGIYRSDDAGATWRKVSGVNPRPMYFSQIRVAPDDANRIYVLGEWIEVSDDGGRTFREVSQLHSDQHAFWIDPRTRDT